MKTEEQQQTISVSQTEKIFFVSAVIILICSIIEFGFFPPSSGSPSYVQLPTVLVALGYWTLSFRGLRLLIGALSGAEARGRSKLIAGVLLKLSALALLGDFMLNITRDKAIYFFITMVGYWTLGLAGVLLFHYYLSVLHRSAKIEIVRE